MVMKMKVVDMDISVLRQYVDGCKYKIKEENNKGTFIEGHKRGIDDALRLVDNEKDLTFVMNMAILGSRHKYDGRQNDQFYTVQDITHYKVGYEEGMDNTVKILTGN